MQKKIYSLLLALILAALCACGTGTTDGAGVEGGAENGAAQEDTSTVAETTTGDVDEAEIISIICTNDDVYLFEHVGALLRERHGVTLELISQAYDNTHQRIATSAAAGGGADIAYIDTIWPAEFGSLGLMTPLDPYLTDEIREGLIESAAAQMVYEGNTYGVPFANNGKWMFYNKKMLDDGGFDAPPETWEELKEMSLSLMDQGLARYGIAWAGRQAEGIICDMTTMIYAFGGSWTDSSGAFAFNSPEAVKALSFMADSISEGWADPASSTYGDRENLDPFMAGDVAFVMNWSFAWGLTNDETQSSVAGDVDICLIPGGGAVRSASVTGGGGVGILAGSENPDAAWKAIELLLSPEVQEFALRDGSTLPTLKSVYMDEDVTAEYGYLSLMYPQYEYAHFRPMIPAYSQWSNTVQAAVSGVLVGQADAQAAMDEAVARSNELIGA